MVMEPNVHELLVVANVRNPLAVGNCKKSRQMTRQNSKKIFTTEIAIGFWSVYAACDTNSEVVSGTGSRVDIGMS